LPTCRSFFATTTRKPLPTPTCRQLCFAFFSLSSLLGSVGRNLFCSSGIRLGNWEGLGAVSQTMPWDPIGTRESGPTTCSQRRLGDQLGNKTTASNPLPSVRVLIGSASQTLLARGGAAGRIAGRWPPDRAPDRFYAPRTSSTYKGTCCARGVHGDRR